MVLEAGFGKEMAGIKDSLDHPWVAELWQPNLAVLENDLSSSLPVCISNLSVIPTNPVPPCKSLNHIILIVHETYGLERRNI